MVDPSFMIVEDGTAKVDSNAYWDIDSVTAYLTNKGCMDWLNYTANEQARAIISATGYIEKRFRNRFRGLRQQVEQALGWPRIGAFDNDSFTIFGIPFQIQFAVAEYALRAARIGVLAPDPMRTVPTQNMAIAQPGLVAGTNTLTLTGNFNDGDTVTIGTRVYLMQAALNAGDGHVHIGASVAASLLNLANAINDNDAGTPGTDYNVLSADSNVTATATLTALVISDVNANANSISVSYAFVGSSVASWATAKISGFSNNPQTPDLILGPVRTKLQRVGPLEQETTYDGLSARSIQDERTTRSAQSGMVNDYNIPEYPEADLWIEMIVRNPSTGVRMIRGS